MAASLYVNKRSGCMTRQGVSWTEKYRATHTEASFQFFQCAHQNNAQNLVSANCVYLNYYKNMMSYVVSIVKFATK